MEQEGNREIEAATQVSINSSIQELRREHEQRIHNLQAHYEQEFQQTRKLFGQDPVQQLLEIAQKKEKLMSISKQKLQSLRNKEEQELNYHFLTLFQRESIQIEKELKFKG